MNTSTETDFDTLWLTFQESPAQLARDQMENMEQRAQDTEHSRGVARRLALATLTRSGQEIIDSIKERSIAVAMADTVRVIDDNVSDLQTLIELMQSASLRITMALCTREDMQEILDEVKAA